MDIILNTDKNIEGTARLESYVKETLNGSMKRFKDHITRIEVHLADENAAKEGNRDKKCTMEARPMGLKPVVVTANDETVEKAINSALDKMKASLDTTIGRLQNR